MSTGREIATVKSLLQRQDYQNRFREILGERAPQFCASVVNVSRDQNIAKCEPASVLAAAVVAATLDLPVDRNLGFAWIVPYKDQASFQLGAKGYIQLALRSGQYARMNARVVNAEAFGGYDEVGEPIILWGKIDESKPPVGYAFAWKLVTGFSKTCYWSKERVEAHAKQYSQSFRGGYKSPWTTHFNEMAIKTVLKNELADWGILSIQMQTAIRHDQGVQRDIESEVVYVDNPEIIEAKPADLSDLNAKLKAEAQASVKPVETPPTQTVTSPAPEIKTPPTATPEAATATVTQPSETDADPKKVLSALIQALGLNEIKPEQALAFCRENKLANDKQTHLSELSTSKLVRLTRAIESNPEVVAKMKVL